MQLVPHYIILAAIVIVTHWIWLFAIKKGGYQNDIAISRKGYQTGGVKDSLSPSNAQQEALIVSRPSTSEDFLNDNTVNKELDKGFATTLIEEHTSDSLSNEGKKNYAPLHQLSEEQAEFDIITAIKSLQEGKSDIEGVKMLDDIAAITVATDRQYPHVMEEVKEILTSAEVNNKEFPFITD